MSENKKNSGKMTAKEAQLERQNRELKKKLEETQKKIEDKKEETPSTLEGKKDKDEEIEKLKAQLELLSKQVASTPVSKAPDYKQDLESYFTKPTDEDILDEDQEVTYVARKVLYVVPSYVDEKGVERYPPHGIIKFRYAASHIVRDGREEDIRNFCQYNTRSKKEIEFLNNHPLYGITFSSNINHMMDESIQDTDFKIMAAEAIKPMTPEAVFQKARDMGIDDQKKSAGELKVLLIHKLAERYKNAASKKHAERIKRSLLKTEEKEQ